MNAYYLLTKRPLRAYELHKKWLVERLSRAPQSTASRLLEWSLESVSYGYVPGRSFGTRRRLKDRVEFPKSPWESGVS